VIEKYLPLASIRCSPIWNGSGSMPLKEGKLWEKCRWKQRRTFSSRLVFVNHELYKLRNRHLKKNVEILEES